MKIILRKSSFCFFLVIAFIASSFWQRTIGNDDVGVTGRIVYGDLFLALGLVAAIFSNIVIKARSLLVSLFLLLVSLSIGMLLSDYPMRVAAEVLVHGFLFAGFAVMVSVLNSERRIDAAMLAFLGAGVVASTIGIIDSVLFSRGGSTILDAPSGYTVLGAATFRNYGQAGNYVAHVILLALAILFSGYAARRRILSITCWMTLLLCLTLLAISSKVASIVGMLCGIFTMALIQFILWRNDRPLKVLFVVTIIFTFGLVLLLSFSGDILSQRLTERALSRIASESGGEGFAASNWSAALSAFADRPLFGTGLGAFAGTYHDYAVHSTLLKLLAEGGGISFLAFIIFAILAISMLPRTGKGKEDSRVRLCALLGWGLLGLSISWLYTYGLRKREFWILFSIFIAMHTFLKLEQRRLRKIS